ncbi:1,3-beta-D-glucan synthase [Ceratobasidium sp. 423]|nr:1,3-beta-D-glucan synthase [Ceratobasidium sp. 423]
MGSVPICRYIDGQLPSGQEGCYNLFPVFDWIKRCMISIFLIFMIAFLLLFIQELTERGAGCAVLRLAKHFLSLSPMFEVFTTQIQSSILVNMSFGGARYIATGRGVATAHILFSILYSRFAGPSIYLNMCTLIMLLYATMVLLVPHLLYFWISVPALIIFPYSDFIIDYREFLRWMSRGNSPSHSNLWIEYCRLSRMWITNYKKPLGHPSEKLSDDVLHAGWRAVLVSEIIAPLCLAVIFTIAYLFVKSFHQEDGTYPPSPFVRLAIVALGPIVWNAIFYIWLLVFDCKGAEPSLYLIWSLINTVAGMARMKTQN